MYNRKIISKFFIVFNLYFNISSDNQKKHHQAVLKGAGHKGSNLTKI